MSKLSVTVGRKALYAGPDGIRVGSKGKPAPVPVALAPLPKGERRRVRKALHAAGRRDLAGAR